MIASAVHFDLLSYMDVVTARQQAREMARELGFGLTDQTRIATAVSEVAHQTLTQQGQARVYLSTLRNNARRGLECICQSAEWLRASGGSVLAGVGRLMDECTLEARSDSEVAVVMRKWLH